MKKFKNNAFAETLDTFTMRIDFAGFGRQKHIENLTHTLLLLRDGGTSGLAATLCLKIGRNSVPMNMLLL